MLETINKENFNQVLTRFSTAELEGLIEKFPYFQQAHLLLAKKYQDQSHPKFDQQLQLAALYTQDRDLFYSIFNERAATSTFVVKVNDVVEIESHKFPEIPVSEQQETATDPVVEVNATVNDNVIAETPAFELSPDAIIAEPVEEQAITTQESVVDTPLEEEVPEQAGEAVITEETAEIAEQEVVLAETEPENEVLQNTEVITVEATEETVAEQFNATEPHTFDEWLKAFSKQAQVKEMPAVAELQQPEIPVEPEKQDEELEKLYIANIPVNLHELVEEETHYSKGLDKFIEEQRQKHRAQVQKAQASENDLDPELITETMARVYEMQKKYNRAIRCYEVLALKYPEKNDFFAARINYLKNIT